MTVRTAVFRRGKARPTVEQIEAYLPSPRAGRDADYLCGHVL